MVTRSDAFGAVEESSLCLLDMKFTLTTTLVDMTTFAVSTFDGHDLSDAALAAAVADRVAQPRDEPANSFVLHAPLELLARVALLPYVNHRFRPEARGRIAEIGDAFEQHEPANLAADDRSFDSPSAATRYLTDAMSVGELDDVDAAARWLTAQLRPAELADALADTILPSLAAAAHAPIFFWLSPRVTPRGQMTGELLRPLVRELARQPSWKLRWIDQRTEQATASAAEMTRALGNVPHLGEGPSNYIYPTMSRVDMPDLAPAILGSVCGPGLIRDRAQSITRAAAWSMLGEPTTHAPYGWSHALTMSQAAIGIASSCSDPSRALATAATFLVGFRASLAVNPLAQSFEVEPSRLSIDDALEAGPDEAAAAGWHARPEQRADLASHLATRAAIHPDAHLAKYVLACLDATGDDPQAARLYLAAAAKLVGYWASISTPENH
jgi:hypothetical protein